MGVSIACKVYLIVASNFFVSSVQGNHKVVLDIFALSNWRTIFSRIALVDSPKLRILEEITCKKLSMDSSAESVFYMW